MRYVTFLSKVTPADSTFQPFFCLCNFHPTSIPQRDSFLNYFEDLYCSLHSAHLFVNFAPSDANLVISCYVCNLLS